MSVVYYNLPNYPKFLPILETINDGKVSSFVSKVDKDMEVSSYNWSNLVTSYTIKNYIDNKVEDLRLSDYLFEDFFTITDSILDTTSGYVISDNITNIFYPFENTKIKFNTKEDIKFTEDDLDVNIPKNSNKVYSGFVFNDVIPVSNIFSNENFDYCLTWNNISDQNYIADEHILIPTEETITYNLGIKDIPLSVSYQGSNISYSIDDNILSIKNNSLYESTIISNILVKDSNLIKTDSHSIRTSLKSYYDDSRNTINNYYNMYQLSNSRKYLEENVGFEKVGIVEYKKIENEHLYDFNLFSGIYSTKSYDISSNKEFEFKLTVKVFADNISYSESLLHLLSIAGVKIFVKSIPTDPNNFNLVLVYSNNLGEEKTAEISNINFVYDTELSLKFIYDNIAYAFKGYIGTTSFINDLVSTEIKLKDTLDFKIGATEEYKGFYGELCLYKEREYSVDLNLLSLNINGDIVWEINKDYLNFDKDTKTLFVNYQNNYMTKGTIFTPVFDPCKTSWKFDIELKIDKESAPESFEIVSSGSNAYLGLNLRYIKNGNFIEFLLNAKDICYNEYSKLGFPNNNIHQINKNIEVPYSGIINFSIEFDGRTYNVYCDEIARRKIAEIKTEVEIEPSYFKLSACDGIQIERRKTHIMLEDKIWWSFDLINNMKDFEYCNLDCSNNLQIINDCTYLADNLESSVSPEIYDTYTLRYPLSRTYGSSALFTFTINGYKPDGNRTILSSLDDSFVIYQKSIDELFIKNGDNEEFVKLGDYRIENTYRIEIINNYPVYIVRLYDICFNLINEIQNLVIATDSRNLSALLLGRTTTDTKAPNISFNLRETYSDKFFWNLLEPCEFVIKEGNVLSYPVVKSVYSDNYIFENKTISSDIHIYEIKNKVFYKNNQLISPNEYIDNEIRIVNNLHNREDNIVYCDIATNSFILNNIEYGLPIAGLKEPYEEGIINHYIYPKHKNVDIKEYCCLKTYDLENGLIYNLNGRVITFNGKYNFKLGSFVSEALEQDHSYSADIQLSNSNNSLEILENENFISTIILSELNITRESSLKDGNFEDNQFQISEEDNVTRYKYFGTKYSEYASIILGYELNNDSFIKNSTTYGIDYIIDKDSSIFDSFATIENMPNSCSIDFKNDEYNSSKLYSIHTVDSYIKNGDFRSLTGWDLDCSDYTTIGNKLYINDTVFTLKQSFYEEEMGEIINDKFNAGEELLLSFTIDDYTNGTLYLEYNDRILSFIKAGIYNIIITPETNAFKLTFTSGTEYNANYSLSNVTLVSLNKVANGKFLSTDYWNIQGANIVENGVKIDISKYIVQKLKLQEGRKYKCNLKINSSNSGEMLVFYLDNHKIKEYSDSGYFEFEFIARDVNELKIIKERGYNTTVLEYISIIELPYNNNCYLNNIVNSWISNTDNVKIKNNKLYINSGYPNYIKSTRIKSNTEYNLSLSTNIYAGGFDICVGDEVNQTVLATFNEIGNNTNVNINFTTNNLTENYIFFKYNKSSNIEIYDCKLELINYVLNLRTIGYNWQTENDNNTIVIENKELLFKDSPVSAGVFQYNNFLEENKEVSVSLLVHIPDESNFVLNFGGNDSEVVIDRTYNDEEFTISGVIGSQKYIKIKALTENANITIKDFQIKSTLNDLYFDISKMSYINSNRNLSITELYLNANQDLTVYKDLDNQLVGLKIGSVYATGYLNIAENKIENVKRSKEFQSSEFVSSSLLLDIHDSIKVLKPNYVFINYNGAVSSYTKLSYGKTKAEASGEVWYNLLDKNYRNYNTNEILYLIGIAYTDNEKVVFTENIQKQRKLLSYTNPYITDNNLRKRNQGLYDISSLFFNGEKNQIIDTYKPVGVYILYKKNTDKSNPYNLDVNELYVDYEHVNSTPVWDSALNMFVSPYTLDEAISEIHINEDRELDIYTLSEEYDIINVESKIYKRLTYKNPNNKVVVEDQNGIRGYYDISILERMSVEKGTKVYWRN